MKLDHLCSVLEAFASYHAQVGDISTAGHLRAISALARLHGKKTVAAFNKALIEKRASQVSQTQPDTDEVTRFRQSIVAARNLLVTLNKAKEAQSFDLLVGTLLSPDTSSVATAISRAEQLLNRATSLTSNGVGDRINREVISRYANQISAKLLDAKSFADIMEKLKADKKGAQKKEVHAIACQVLGVNLSKSRTREAYLEEIRGRHVTDMRLAGKEKANSRMGKSWGGRD